MIDELTKAHKEIAWVVGQLSLALSMRTVRKSELAKWVARLREYADKLDALIKTK